MTDSFVDVMQAAGMDQASANIMAGTCVTNGQFAFVVNGFINNAGLGRDDNLYANSLLELAGIHNNLGRNYQDNNGFNLPANLGEGPFSWQQFFEMELHGIDTLTMNVADTIRHNAIQISPYNFFAEDAARGKHESCSELLLGEAKTMRGLGVTSTEINDDTPKGYQTAANRYSNATPTVG